MKKWAKPEMRPFRPTSYNCCTCPEWDDVNGCWQDYDDVRKCDLDNEYEPPFGYGEDDQCPVRRHQD